MKNLLLITMLSASVAFASSQHVNGLEKDTTLVVLEGQSAKQFSKTVKQLVDESGAEQALKRKLESSARIAEKQAEMREKYKVDLSHKDVADYKIIKARTEQHNLASKRAKKYLDVYFKRLDNKTCSELKDSQLYKKAICKAKNENKVNEAIDDLKSIERVDSRAYCMKSMIRLMKDTSNAVSETTKDFMLLKLRKFKRTTVCVDSFKIASAKE